MKDRRSELSGRSPLMSYKRQQMPQMRSSGRRSPSRERRHDRDDAFTFQHNDILPDHNSLNPTFIGQSSSRSFYSDHLPIGSISPASDRMRGSGSNFGMGIRDVEMHSFNDDDIDRRHVQLRLFEGLRRSALSDGLAIGIGRYSNDRLEHYAYNQATKTELRDESRVYDYDEFQPRGMDDRLRSVQDEPYKKRACVSRNEFGDSTSLSVLDHCGDWMHKDGSFDRSLIRRNFSERQYHLRGDVARDYDDAMGRQELPTYSGNWHGGLRIKSPRDYENMNFEEGFGSEKEFYPIYRRSENRSSKSLLSDHELDERKLSMSAHDRSHVDGLGDYHIERMERRNYGIIKDIDDNDSRVVFMNDQHFLAPYENEEMWPTEELLEPSLPKSRVMEHSRFRKISRGFSTSDAFMPSSSASSMHAKSDLNSNLKRRLKYNRSDFHTPYFSEQKQGMLRSYKYLKRGMQDRLGTQGRGTHESIAHVVKNDPPEDSEEFKQQVHKAFLRYSKLLNESQHNRRIYQSQGNNYSLLCSVCGSNSKEFIDTNSLVTHSYHSLKVGLKTEHLGFHKALCVLMGWNWRVPPENSRAYQSMLVADAKAMREDLILWPPFVIIHNILFGDKSSTKDAKVTIESLEKILRDMGFGVGKITVCLGKPANQSIFTVKFLPTFSGFQTAERLHKHFADKKHGRAEFEQRSSRGKSGEGKKQSEQQVDEFLLFGYMAVAEDLDKLHLETKKRSMLKSKKDDIEAIADAPLNTH